MHNPLYELDIRIGQASADQRRSVAIATAGGTVLVSQLLLRGQASPDSADSEAEQFGASIAEGIIAALTAPLLYASVALLLVFGVLTFVYSVRHRTLLAERTRMLGFQQPPPMPQGRPWQQRQQ